MHTLTICNESKSTVQWLCNVLRYCYILHILAFRCLGWLKHTCTLCLHIWLPSIMLDEVTLLQAWLTLGWNKVFSVKWGRSVLFHVSGISFFQGVFGRETQKAHSTLVSIWRTASVDAVKQSVFDASTFLMQADLTAVETNVHLVRRAELMWRLSFCWPPHANLFRTASKGLVEGFTLLTKCSDVVKVKYYNSWHADRHGCVNEKMQPFGAKEYQRVLWKQH